MLDVCCVRTSYDEYIAMVKTGNECRGAKWAIRGLKMGVTVFVWNQLNMFLIVALDFGWLRFFFSRVLQTIRGAGDSVVGAASHWRTRWKIRSTATRCTSFLRARFSAIQECVDTWRKPFHRVTRQTLPMRFTTWTPNSVLASLRTFSVLGTCLRFSWRSIFRIFLASRW